MTTTATTARETKVRTLLARIATANDAGTAPTKAAVVGHVPTKTRAADYRRIDHLIRRGLVANETTKWEYALRVTPAGIAELEAWA